MKSIKSKALNSLSDINKWIEVNNVTYHNKCRLNGRDILKIYYEWIVYGDVFRYDKVPNDSYIIAFFNYNYIKTISKYLESKYYIIIC